MQGNRIFAVMDGVRRGISFVSGFTGAAFVFSMTMPIMIDVFLRIFAGVTTYVATEWSGYMLVGIGFLGLAYTQKRGKHIQIKMVTSRLPEGVRKKLEIVILIVGVLFIGWLPQARWNLSSKVTGFTGCLSMSFKHPCGFLL